MPADMPESLAVDVVIQKVDARGPVSNWDDDTKMWVSFNERDRAVSLVGNRAALTSLARHLLTLAQPGTEAGNNLFWEAESGWFETNDAGLHIALAE